MLFSFSTNSCVDIVYDEHIYLPCASGFSYTSRIASAKSRASMTGRSLFSTDSCPSDIQEKYSNKTSSVQKYS